MSASSARSDELFEVPKLSHPRSCKAVCGLPHVTNAVNGSELHSLLSELRRTALEPFLTAEHGTGQDFRVSVLASSIPVCASVRHCSGCRCLASSFHRSQRWWAQLALRAPAYLSCRGLIWQ